MFGVWKEFRADGLFTAASGPTRRRQSSRVSPLRQSLYYRQPTERTREDSQRRETVQVFTVRREIRSTLHSEETPESARSKQTLLLLYMWEGLQEIKKSCETYKDASQLTVFNACQMILSIL